MRAVVMFTALVLPIGVVMPLGTSHAASNDPARAPAPVSVGQPVFIPIDRTHVLIAPPPRAAPNGAQRQSGGTFVSPSAGAGSSAAMPFYPPRTTR